MLKRTANIPVSGEIVEYHVLPMYDTDVHEKGVEYGQWVPAKVLWVDQSWSMIELSVMGCVKKIDLQSDRWQLPTRKTVIKFTGR